MFDAELICTFDDPANARLFRVAFLSMPPTTVALRSTSRYSKDGGLGDVDGVDLVRRVILLHPHQSQIHQGKKRKNQHKEESLEVIPPQPLFEVSEILFWSPPLSPSFQKEAPG